MIPSMLREPTGFFDRWVVEVADVQGNVHSREGYFLRRTAEQRARHHNAHARRFVKDLNLDPELKAQLPDQLYYVKVRRRA